MLFDWFVNVATNIQLRTVILHGSGENIKKTKNTGSAKKSSTKQSAGLRVGMVKISGRQILCRLLDRWQTANLELIFALEW